MAHVGSRDQHALLVDNKPAGYPGPGLSLEFGGSRDFQFTADGAHLFVRAGVKGANAMAVLVDGRPFMKADGATVYTAPVGNGEYQRSQIESVLVTAYTGFAAAVAESHRMWPGAKVEVRTGFWGCGAFGGNRRAMTLLQLLAARLAGIDRLLFYVFDDAGMSNFLRGAADLLRVLSRFRPAEPVGTVIDRIADLGYEWGVSDGN